MSAPPPRQWLEPGLQIACHRHDSPYLSVVLEGSYEEAGDRGRRRLEPGDVAVRGAVVLNLPASGVNGLFGRLCDPDAVIFAARTDPLVAASLVSPTMIALPPQGLDWPDELAAETLSRGFRRTFGVAPKRFRHEVKTRRALAGAIETAEPPGAGRPPPPRGEGKR